MKKKGSITVEASLCLPIFFLISFSLCYLFEFSYNYLIVQEKLEKIATEYEGTKVQVPVMEDGRQQIHIVQWKLQDGKGKCYVDWSESVPFAGQALAGHFYQQIVVNDYSGESMEPEGEDDTYVYVAETGRVYHLDIMCTYLKLGIQQVTAGEIKTKRNQAGGKYKSCEQCCKGQSVEDLAVAFITPYGDRFHASKECSGLRRTVHKRKKSEVGTMPACSKCGG